MSEQDHNFVENSSDLYQAIDASLNRCAEGLRVAEEIFRFVQPDEFLASELKDTRHLLAAIADQFSRNDLIKARNGPTDLGRNLVGAKESHRTSLSEILCANLNRATESMRVIEEFSKLDSPEIATRCESLRYRIYDLQKACELAVLNKHHLESIRICILVDAKESNDAFVQFIQRLGDWPKMIQLRDKEADDITLVDRGKTLTTLLRGSDSLWIMNDRADLAIACGADGVHVGQDDLPVVTARKIVGPDRLVGVSTHDVSQVEKAVMDGADYVGVGPTFPSSTKSFDQFPGLPFIEKVSQTFSIPAFAIGGVNDSNIGQIVDAGGTRVAVAAAAKDLNALQKIQSTFFATTKQSESV